MEHVLVSPESQPELTRSKERVAAHGEVFTPSWMVDAMLELVHEDTARIDSRFLEPACGSGNFLVRVLRSKLISVDQKFGDSEFERNHYALLAVMCIYGIELLRDNIDECRTNLLEVLDARLRLTETDTVHRAASYVLTQNLIHGDALTMRTNGGAAITFAEWGYLGKGKFQRRDFRLDTLMQAATFQADGSLFASLGRHELFTPTGSHAPVTMAELASHLGEAIPQ